MSGSPLISPGLIARLRRVANRGLQTDVSILTRQAVGENPYGDDEEAWVDVGTFKGWLRGVNTARLEDVGDVVGTVGIFRLHLEATVELHPGDLVGVDGEIYVVQDSNLENTYRVFTTATLRRRQ